MEDVLKILIVGAGVSGLTTALCVREKYPYAKITIIADKFGEKTTSSIAGALWEWQPAVCGFYENLPESIKKRDNKWAMSSYRKFYQLKEHKHTGIHWRTVNFYLTEDTSLERKKISELSNEVIDFNHDSSAIFKNNGIDKDKHNFVDAYSYLTPMIDTSIYINWLINQFLNSGGLLISENIQDMKEVINKYYPDLIINCTGLNNCNLMAEHGSSGFADRQCLPVQGGWLLYDNLSINEHPRVKEAHCTTIQENKEGGNFIFIVPRGNDKLVVGGFAVANEWNTQLTLDNPFFKRIIDSNSRILPWLPKFKPIDYRVGLRPFRIGGARVELDNSFSIPIIHNYGHGGSGVTLSWGCADYVAELF